MKQKSENKNSRKRVSKWVYRILMLIAACVFAYSAFQLGSIYYANYKEKQETEELKGSIKTVKKNGQEELRSVDFEKLREINPDVIAWQSLPKPYRQPKKEKSSCKKHIMSRFMKVE